MRTIARQVPCRCVPCCHPNRCKRSWEFDVGSFAYGVLTGVCATDIYIQGIAAVATGDDDGLLCELTERLQDSFAELFFKDRDEL